MRRKGWAVWRRGCSQGLPVGSEGSPIRPRALPFGSLHLYLGNFGKDQDKLSNEEAHSLLIHYCGLRRYSNPTSQPWDEFITILALLFGMLANGKEAPSTQCQGLTGSMKPMRGFSGQPGEGKKATCVGSTYASSVRAHLMASLVSGLWASHRCCKPFFSLLTPPNLPDSPSCS